MSTPLLPSYCINGETSTVVINSIKELRIMFSTDLHWDSHYNTITSKAYKILYLLQRTFILPSATARKCLYLMLVRSQLTYCSPLLRPYLIINTYNPT